MKNISSSSRLTQLKDEYIIINKTTIQKRIDEWEVDLQECFKAPIGEFNHDYVSTLQQAISTSREILSQSTPLIPEIEKALSYVAPIHARMDYQTHCKLKQEYISNLKLDI